MKLIHVAIPLLERHGYHGHPLFNNDEQQQDKAEQAPSGANSLLEMAPNQRCSSRTFGVPTERGGRCVLLGAKGIATNGAIGRYERSKRRGRWGFRPVQHRLTMRGAYHNGSLERILREVMDVGILSAGSQYLPVPNLHETTVP